MANEKKIIKCTLNNETLYFGTHTDAVQVTEEQQGGQFLKKSLTQRLAELAQAIANVHSFEYVVVNSLPTASADTMNKIYLVPAQPSGDEAPDENKKEEYITVQENSTYRWEKIGVSYVDLSDYPTIQDMNTALVSLASDVTDGDIKAGMALDIEFDVPTDAEITNVINEIEV